MPDDIIIGMKSIPLRGTIDKTPILKRTKENIFSRDELDFLHSLSLEDLWTRYRQGENLIKIVKGPDIMNISSSDAQKIADNLSYQMDVIMSIIKKRISLD